MQKRVIFKNKALPYALLLPQLAITVVFFIWPAGMAVYYSLLLQDPFGLRTQFIWFENFQVILSDPLYLESLGVTFVFSASVTVFSMSSALLFAAMADKNIRGANIYKTLLIWPYALAPAVAAVLWLFIFHPQIGIVGRRLNQMGLDWDYKLNDRQALGLVIFAAAWKQVSYNFLFFLAGMQSIPRSVLEAAAIDGASSRRRFWTIVFPLLSPTTFFLLVVNLVYAFFDTFGVIHAVTQGGPGNSTQTLIYKVYEDGVVNLDLGGSSAESVILMVIVMTLTAVQFRVVERKVHYG
ncbi:MAG: sn-glycerol-3-phosphate ABC transporter permease UgpA [Proteobacteria bacterium]|nr:sn-glycerol-3-phosphate ABC transporter permease UgpA [Pseudomonadota bacterium]